ncbi:TIGR04540 family protein [Clostridium sp. BSD9I1]|uniref:TIGR04540 family protein n=1 Tax=Clostridium sp. BSD9I1 TaxID=2003589 RepID=UPI0016444E87|nr:TIGR04540 family protein [Clostridium sp. BSD9I1]
MNIKLFYKTQREIAHVLNQIVDQYWENNLNEKELISYISSIYRNNTGKVKKGSNYTSILQQICGKRRLEVINKILEMNKETNKEK